MSAADLRQAGGLAGSAGTAPAAAPGWKPRRFSARFFASELMLIFGRRRNWVGGLILAAVPVLIAIAVKVSPSSGADSSNFINQIAGNGIFVALASLVLEIPLFLPIAVASIAGDAVAGEANLGTLRYLLSVPVDRTRLLLVKFGAIAVFALAATLLVALVGALLGLALFGGGPVLTLSGTLLPFWTGVGRLLLIVVYVAICMTALGGIGLFVSTLTEQPIAATIATLILALGSEISDAVPQLSAIHRFLPTHYWLAFGDLMRDPVSYDRIVPGLLSAALYLAIFGTAAWARFGGRDVTS
jgi:ABC-2 type transport system permease protein